MGYYLPSNRIYESENRLIVSLRKLRGPDFLSHIVKCQAAQARVGKPGHIDFSEFSPLDPFRIWAPSQKCGYTGGRLVCQSVACS